MTSDWTVTHDCGCEHCGTLPPYTPTYWDGNASWCEDCSAANGYPEPAEDDRKVFWMAQVSYHTEALKKLGSQN